MQNIIAIIWDFDKTLVDGYMQDPIFEEYNTDSKKFWEEVGNLPEKYKEEQGIQRVNKDTIYLNHFIKYAKEARFKGLNNTKLRSFGEKQKFYKGIPEIFKTTSELLKNDVVCQEYNIKVEHYIVSTGFAELIRGTSIMDYVQDVWGCEMIEGKDQNGDTIISEIAYTIDNTTKTRAIFEINKGTNKHPEISVNSRMSDEQRRVDFKNMIYIADGPSDVPAFSVIKEHGGATFAIYPKGQHDAFKQVEQLRAEGRIDMFAEADYSNDTTASIWICNKIKDFAERIKKEEQAKRANISQAPMHLV
ncbi:MAG: haloacid dehalogenase-like hydrolase [Bacteroidales bacterium]|nr:haloacid dehalogenase-like hydrolase [Bacteroidales bacterium]